MKIGATEYRELGQNFKIVCRKNVANFINNSFLQKFKSLKKIQALFEIATEFFLSN